MKRILLAVVPLALVALGCTTPTSPSVLPPTSPAEKVSGSGSGTGVRVGAGGKAALDGDNTKITFVGTKPGGKHNGGFNKLNGEITLVSMQPGGKSVSKISSVKIEIDTESLWADDQKLTTHLKSADFFDVAKHKTITFTSTKVELGEVKGTVEEAKITGDLELHGVKKTITIPVSMSFDKGFWISTSFDLSRKEFGMTYGEGKVDDKVTVSAVIGKKPA